MKSQPGTPLSGEQLGSSVMLSRRIVVWSLLVVAVVTASLTAGVVMAQGASGHVPACGQGHGTTRSFTIIADLNGFNNSKYLQSSWPVLTVHRCDTVVITVINRDAQAHGLAVTTYAPNGVTVAPGTTQTLRFQANQKGNFRIYCNIFCTVHVFMQNGLLEVK